MAKKNNSKKATTQGSGLYRKVGHRYVECSTTEPLAMPGLWVVTEGDGWKARSWVGRMCDIPNIPAAAALMAHVDTAAAAITAEKDRMGHGIWPSPYQTARAVLLAVAAKAGA